MIWLVLFLSIDSGRLNFRSIQPFQSSRSFFSTCDNLFFSRERKKRKEEKLTTRNINYGDKRRNFEEEKVEGHLHVGAKENKKN